MNLYNKHYIRLNEGNLVIKGFSDAFEKPLDTDICINQEGGRHFEINGVINPPLINTNGCHLYKYESDLVVKTTQEEQDEEFSTFPVLPTPPTVEELQEKLDTTSATLDSVLTELIPSLMELIS